MKSRSEFVCQQCGYKSASYLGRCPECGSWNSLVETPLRQDFWGQASIGEIDLVRLSEVKGHQIKRLTTGYSEFDRVLGGGIVPGSIVLIAGDPGIGKSTLLLQVAIKIAGFARGPVSSFLPAYAKASAGKPASASKGSAAVPLEAKRSGVGIPSRTATPRKTPGVSNVNGQLSNVVLYVTGEESAQQVKIRADRIAKDTNRLENLYILAQTDVEAIIAACQKLQPSLVVVDSIQTLTSDKLTGSAGSVGQVRECAQILQRHAKESARPIFLVGHVTKEGNIAGPKVLEHLVDAVLSLEGDVTHAFRLLRTTKNRFGSTFEVGVFEMQDVGLIEVENPSKLFLAQRLTKRAGSVVTSTIAGGRPLLCEIQALTTSTIFGVPTRRVTGLDFARMQIVIAALTRAANLPLASLDIYINVAGGLRIVEPAADLASALAIVSAAVEKPIKEEVCAFGEVGLLGELRPVAFFKNRIEEAKRLGFSDFVSPENFKTLEEAIAHAVHGG